MGFKIKNDCSDIDWNYVSQTLRKVGMNYFEAKIHQIAFENSHTVAFIFDEEKLIGFGRAISDGVYQAALYDIAVLPEYQGKGIGRLIVNNIVESLPKCSFILYAAPGKEKFYEQLNFRKMKTGMALFQRASDMKERGFTE